MRFAQFGGWVTPFGDDIPGSSSRAGKPVNLAEGPIRRKWFLTETNAPGAADTGRPSRAQTASWENAPARHYPSFHVWRNITFGRELSRFLPLLARIGSRRPEESKLRLRTPLSSAPFPNGDPAREFQEFAENCCCNEFPIYTGQL